MGSELPEAFAGYAGLSVPAIITDAAYVIVYLNARAEAFFGTTLAAVRGQMVNEALHLDAPDGHLLREWANAVLHPAFVTGDPFACRAVLPDGQATEVRIAGTRLSLAGQWYFAMTVVPEVERRATAEMPSWALRDPLTGLFNRHQWQREQAERDSRPGTVVFFDLDDLKALNDQAGHQRGDQALIAVARALEAHAPAGAIVIRLGGDEFLAVLGEQEPEQAEAFARAVVAATAAAGLAARLPVPLRLGYGVAAFAPGGLEAALRAADENLYIHKGVLLRAAGGGRIVLQSRTSGPRLMVPGGASPGTAPGAFATAYGPEFDGYFRQMFARASEQAREFVDFVRPQPGSAVVEVGAGTGRIALDGRLAERVGAEGQLLLTDPSAAQLQVARQRAEVQGLSWLRFLVAPVEDLPLAPGTVDLVLGSTFLHFTEAPVAIQAMARLIRPGGRVAISALMPQEWGAAQMASMEPVRAFLAARGMRFPPFGIAPDDLVALFEGAGLVVDDTSIAQHERMSFPNGDVAIGALRQLRLVPLFLRGVPEAEQEGLQEKVEAAFRVVVEREGIGSADIAAPMISLVASRRR